MINAPLFYHISWHNNDIFNTNHIITCPWPINETGPNKCKWLPLGARSHQVPQTQGPVLRLRWGRWQDLLQAAEVVPESSSEEVGGECAGGFQRGRMERAPGLGRQLGVRKGRDAHAAQLPGLRAVHLGLRKLHHEVHRGAFPVLPGRHHRHPEANHLRPHVCHARIVDCCRWHIAWHTAHNPTSAQKAAFWAISGLY